MGRSYSEIARHLNDAGVTTVIGMKVLSTDGEELSEQIILIAASFMSLPTHPFIARSESELSDQSVFRDTLPTAGPSLSF
jgi:hypothetical protein